MMRTTVVSLLFLLMLGSGVCAQSPIDIKPPAENLSRPELEKWLLQTLSKYGEYTSEAMSVSVASAKFTGCTLNFEVIRKANPRQNDPLHTVYKTRRVKHPVSIDVSRVASISIVDYLDPELQTIVLTVADSPTTNGSEIIVRQVASSALKTAFERVRAFCAGTK